MSDFQQSLADILTDTPERLVLSKQVSRSQEYRKVVIEKKSDCYQIAKYTEKQVFHENCGADRLAQYLAQTMGAQFLQLNGWSAGKEHQLLMSKKGTVTYKKRSCQTPRSRKAQLPTIAEKTICCRKAVRSLRSLTWVCLQKRARSCTPCTTNSVRSTALSNSSTMQSGLWTSPAGTSLILAVESPI